MIERLKEKKNIAMIIIGLILSVFVIYSIHTYLYTEVNLVVYLFMIIIGVALSIYLVYRIVHQYKNRLNTSSFVWEFIFSLIIGTIVIKSFVINIFPIATMASIIMSGVFFIGWVIFGCAVVYLLVHLLGKISWQSHPLKKEGFKQYLLYTLPSLVILGIMFAIYYPGTGSIDTTYLWKCIHENHYSDTHPLTLMLYYKFLTLLWDDYGVLGLFQYLFTSLAFGYVASYFSAKGLKKVWSYVVAIILPLYPVCALYTVTLWKDVPYSVALLVFFIMTIKVFEDDYLDSVPNMMKYTAAGLAVMFIRHNGFVSIFGAGGLIFLYALFNENYKLVLKTIIIGVALAGIFIGFKNGAKIVITNMGTQAEEVQTDVQVNVDKKEENNTPTYTQATLIPTTMPTIIAVQQMIYTEHFNGDEFTQAQKDQFAKYIYLDELEQHKEKYFFGTKYGSNWEFYHKPNKTQRPIPMEDIPEFWSYYFELFRQHPITMLDAYQKQIGVTWASVGYGPTPFRAYYKDEIMASCSPEYLEFVTPIREFLDENVFYVYGGIFIVFVRTATFLMGILILCIVGYKRHKIKYVLAMGPVFMNTLAYLFVISSQDLRYFYINILAFPAALLYALMKNSKEETEEVKAK